MIDKLYSIIDLHGFLSFTAVTYYNFMDIVLCPDILVHIQRVVEVAFSMKG